MFAFSYVLIFVSSFSFAYVSWVASVVVVWDSFACSQRLSYLQLAALSLYL